MTFSLVYASGLRGRRARPGHDRAPRSASPSSRSAPAASSRASRPTWATSSRARTSTSSSARSAYFYLAINAGSSISIYFCPVLLEQVRAARSPSACRPSMMFFATLVFWLGRKKFAVVPPAGKAWLRDVFSKEGLKTIGSLAIIYLFVAFFWALWDQSNGQTWTLAGRVVADGQEPRLRLHAPAGADPGRQRALHPRRWCRSSRSASTRSWAKFFKVTPLRKIAVGLFIDGELVPHRVVRSRRTSRAATIVSVWWQILAYVVLSAAEVLVSASRRSSSATSRRRSG